jgi:hypothetical protein
MAHSAGFAEVGVSPGSFVSYLGLGGGKVYGISVFRISPNYLRAALVKSGLNRTLPGLNLWGGQ